MVHGTWAGHIEGNFEARRSPDRTALPAAERQPAAQPSATTEDEDIPDEAHRPSRAAMAELEEQLALNERERNALEDRVHRAEAEADIERDNARAAERTLEDLRRRYERMESSGDGYMDSSSRVDHLNDRLIARHQEVDQILRSTQTTSPQRQTLQLATAQDNVLVLRAWLARFREGPGKLPAPRPTTDPEFDASWGVMMKGLAKALRPPEWSARANLSASLLSDSSIGSPDSTMRSMRSDGSASGRADDTDPLVLRRKLDKTKKQFKRVSHALVSDVFYNMVEAYRRSAQAGTHPEGTIANWHRISDYLKSLGFSSGTVATVKDWAQKVPRKGGGAGSPGSPGAGSGDKWGVSPTQMAAVEREHDRELQSERAAASRAFAELDRCRARLVITDGELNGLRESTCIPTAT